MPQARQGGKGVWIVAVDGSKLDGTGLEKVQMVQTQVAALTGAESTGKRGDWDWDGVPLREGG